MSHIYRGDRHADNRDGNQIVRDVSTDVEQQLPAGGVSPPSGSSCSGPLPLSSPSPHPRANQASTSPSSASLSLLNERGGRPLREKELQAEVTALAKSLDGLQKTLVTMQANHSKLRSDSKSLYDDCEVSSDQQTVAFQQAINDLQMHNDAQLVKANKIFATKLEKAKSRYEEANKQVSSLLASMNAVNESANNARIQRDEANLELTKSKIEILSLRKKLEETIQQSVNSKQQASSVYYDNDDLSESDGMSPLTPTPPSDLLAPKQPSKQSKPSSARPVPSRGRAAVANGSTAGNSFPVAGTLPEWRRRILESYGIDDNGSAFDMFDFGFGASEGKSKGKKVSPYNVNTVHEVPVNSTIKFENISVPKEILNEMTSFQKNKCKRPASTNSGVRKGNKAAMYIKDKDKSENAARITKSTTASAMVEKSVTAKDTSKSSPNTSKTTSNKKTTTMKDVEQRIMKYEDDLSSVSAANIGLVNVVKSVYALLNTMYRENEQLSDEVNDLNAKLVAMEYEGTTVAANILKSRVRKDVIEDRVLGLMNDALRSNEEFIAGLMESNQYLTHAVLNISNFHHEINAGRGDNQDPNDRKASSMEHNHTMNDQYKLIADLTNSITDLETILVDTKSQCHHNQLHLLSVKKEREESQVKLMLMENELNELRREKDSRNSRDTFELKSRRIAYESMIKEHKEAIAAVHRVLMSLPDGISNTNMIDEDHHSPIQSGTHVNHNNKSYHNNSNNQDIEASTETKIGNSKVVSTWNDESNNYRKDTWANSSGRPNLIGSGKSNDHDKVERGSLLRTSSPNNNQRNPKSTSTCPSPWGYRRNVMSVSLTSEISRDMNSDKGVYLTIPKRSEERSKYTTPGVLDTVSIVSEDTREDLEQIRPLSEDTRADPQQIRPIQKSEKLSKLIDLIVRENADIDDYLHEQVGKFELPSGWVERTSETGALYYWDETRQQSAWMNPNMSVLIEEVDLQRRQQQKLKLSK